MTNTPGEHGSAADSDLIFLVGPDGRLIRAPSRPYEAEADLQKLLADNIDLLPGEQINSANPRRWMLIKREAGVPQREGGEPWWSIDHLAVDQDAIPTFIEVKRASDTRTRRTVVAQMLDYAANGSVYWAPEQLRAWFEGDDPDAANERLMDFLGRSDDAPGEAADEFWRTVGANLRESQIRLIFVADEIPPTLQRLVEFLNEQMSTVEVLAVQIRQYQAHGSSAGALVPRLIGQTARAQAVKEQLTPTRRRTPRTPDGVVAAIAEAGGETAIAEAIRDWALTNPYTKITGGTGSYESFTVSVDTLRSRSRFRGVLTLYSSPYGGPAMLEIGVKRMRRTPPFTRAEEWHKFGSELHALDIPRLSTEADLAGTRPNIPLDQLTDGRLNRLLDLVDRWIDAVRDGAAEPEPAEEA